MTGKERMLAAMRGEPVDRIPVSPILFFMFPMKHAGCTAWNLWGLREPHVSTMKAVVDSYRYFGFESWYKGYLDVPWAGESEKEIVPLDDERLEVRTTLHLPHGELFWRTLYPKFDAEWTVEYPIKDPARQEKLIMDLLSFDAVSKASWESLQKAVEYTGQDGIVTVTVNSWWGWWLTLRGSQNGLMDIYLYPQVMKRIYQMYREYIREYAKIAAKSPADALYGAGGSFTTLSLISPELWEDFVCEPLHEIAQIAHDAGKPLCHMVGNIGMRLLERIVESGADAISPCERPPLGDWVIREIRKRVGQKICIVGNVDPINTLWRGTPEKVETEIREILRDNGGNTRLILATSDQVARDTPVDNLRTFRKRLLRNEVG